MATFEPGIATSDPSLRTKYTAERKNRFAPTASHSSFHSRKPRGSRT